MLINGMNSIYFSDAVPTVCVQSWPLEAQMFDGLLLAGPMPTLFSEDTEAAEESISADLLKAHWDLQKISKRFIMPELLTLKEAVDFIRKPR